MNHFPVTAFSGFLILLGTAIAADLPAITNLPALGVAELAGRIRAHSDGTTAAEMRPYTNSIPGTKASYAMVPIAGGEFLMGSPTGSRYAKPEELPPHRVRIEPFWMGRCEVTWNEFDAFVFDQLDGRPPAANQDRSRTDAVTHPTLPYVDMSFGMGKSGFPAIGMTQHAANKYCQWLSAKTGHCYRLPTEAEWEYAARAGTTNAWFFGDDETRLGEYAWFDANSHFKYQKVGGKRPNPWGLHDILGNVSEWVLDQFDEGYYQVCADAGITARPWNKAAKPYPHSVRGGAWSDPPENVRCAARGRSDPKWKNLDPQFPRSVFWLRSCDFVGFRIVRPLAIPTIEEMRQYWNNGVEQE